MAKKVSLEGTLGGVAGGVVRRRCLAGGLTHDVGGAVVAVKEGVVGGHEDDHSFVLPVLLPVGLGGVLSSLIARPEKTRAGERAREQSRVDTVPAKNFGELDGGRLWGPASAGEGDR